MHIHTAYALQYLWKISWLALSPGKFPNILPSILSSMCIMWESAILLEQHINFLFQVWQQNRLNNVLNTHDVQHSLHKHYSWARILTYGIIIQGFWHRWVFAEDCHLCMQYRLSFAWRQMLSLSLNTTEYHSFTQVTLEILCCGVKECQAGSTHVHSHT